MTVLVECPQCEGAGEVVTRQDYWGNWNSERCRLCDDGEVTPDKAAYIRDLLDAGPAS